MSVSFEGFNEKFATFQCASGLTAGTPVKLTANGKVGACSKGERMIGVAAAVSLDNHALVQVEGYVQMAYSGTNAPALGWTKMVTAEGGGLTADSATAGSEYLVLDVDSTSSKVGFML